MKIGFYPGSFNPWHDGHDDVLSKALQVFDHVVIALGINPEKATKNKVETFEIINNTKKYGDRVSVLRYTSLMVDAISAYENEHLQLVSAVIRGLRNGHDLQYEMNLQYWNEDLGLRVPVVYFVTDRKLCHLSSSAIREISKFPRDKTTSG